MLAIDAVIGRGSVSIWKDGTECSSIIGDEKQPFSVTILGIIEQVCSQNEIDLPEIDCIAVSHGPGSYTGIRVGIATVLGLKAAIGCRTVGVSTLKAIAFEAESAEGKILTALTAGGRELISQEFETFEAGIREVGDPGLIAIDSINDYTAGGIVVDRRTLEIIRQRSGNSGMTDRIRVSSENVSALVGRCAVEQNYSGDIEPIYSRQFGNQKPARK